MGFLDLGAAVEVEGCALVEGSSVLVAFSFSGSVDFTALMDGIWRWFLLKVCGNREKQGKELFSRVAEKVAIAERKGQRQKQSFVSVLKEGKC